MKVRKQFSARVAGTNTMLPGRTRKPERHAELVGVTAIEGTPWFSAAMRVPYRGGLAQAGVEEGDNVTFIATLTGEESEQQLSYLTGVVVILPAAAAVVPAPVVPVVPTPATLAAPTLQVIETFTARVGEYSLLPRSEGTTPERHVELKDVTDTTGAVRLDSTLVPCALLGRFLSGPGDEIRFTAVLAQGRLNGITEIERVRSHWQVVRGDDAG